MTFDGNWQMRLEVAKWLGSTAANYMTANFRRAAWPPAFARKDFC